MDVVQKVTDGADKTPDDPLQNQNVHSKHTIYSELSDHYNASEKLYYSEASSSIDNHSQTRAINWLQLASVHITGADEERNHITKVVRTALFLDTYRAHDFFSEKSIPFLQDMT